MTKTLQERIDAWKEHGKRDDEVAYGMLCDGLLKLSSYSAACHGWDFLIQRIQGIPDDFYSAEDQRIEQTYGIGTNLKIMKIMRRVATEHKDAAGAVVDRLEEKRRAVYLVAATEETSRKMLKACQTSKPEAQQWTEKNYGQKWKQ